MLKKLYDLVLSWSSHRRAVPLLWFASVIDSVFFPIPPLVMLIPMMLAQPKRSFTFALITTIASIIGGLIAYGLGYFFSAQLMPPITNYLGGQETFNCISASYQQYGFLAVLIWGFLPVPYKVITWASGFFHMPILAFVVASFLGRILRYGGIAILFYFFGDSAKKLIDRYFNVLTIMGIGVLILGVIWYYHRGDGGLPAICQ